MNLSKDNLHHAYILEGEHDLIYPKLCDFCEQELTFSVKANPDFIYEITDKFLISNARRLREIQMNKTKIGGRKIFVVAFNFITREAQNALLKVLEEPTGGTHFFIITPSSHVFLDTVLSRVIVISDFKEESGETDAGKFMKSNIKDRLSMITKLVTAIKNEKASKADAILLVRDIKKKIHKESLQNKNLKRLQKLGEIQKVEDYLHDSSASVKILLEYVAITV